MRDKIHLSLFVSTQEKKGFKMNQTIFFGQAQKSSCCKSTANEQLASADLSASSTTNAGSGCCSNFATISEDEIREKAYFLWEQAGRPEGNGADFWIEAERVLLTK